MKQKSKPLLLVRSIYTALKVIPQSISSKLNCQMEQKVKPRGKIPMEELMMALGLTPQDKDLIEISYVGQRAIEAIAELEFSANKIFNQLRESSAAAAATGHLPLPHPKMPTMSAYIICDPSVLTSLDDSRAALMQLVNPSSGVNIEVHKAVQIPASKVMYPKGDIGGYNLVKITLPEIGADGLADKMCEAAGAAPVFCGRKLDVDNVDEVRRNGDGWDTSGGRKCEDITNECSPHAGVLGLLGGQVGGQGQGRCHGSEPLRLLRGRSSLPDRLDSPC